MNSNKAVNCAEAADKMNKGVAWGLFLIAITYGIEAASFLVSESSKEMLNTISGVTTIMTVLAILWGMWPVIKLKMQNKITVGQEPESFFSNAMHASFKNSWIASTVLLVVLLSVANRLEALELPIKFYLIALFSFTTFIASLSFLILTRDSGAEE